MSLAALVRHLCLRAGLPESRIDVTGLWGAVEGYAITALESPRASITTLSRHFGFDAVETEGVIRFVMRGRASVATLAPDDLVAAREGDLLELTRGQETELPQALKWQVARADEDYDAALVETRRITVDTTRIASESFPMAVPPEEAERRCRRALMEAWVGRETAAFRLPPSRLALDPADAIRLEHDGRLVDLRLVSIADAEARGIEAVRSDRATYDLPPGDPRAASLTRAVVFGAPDAVLMDLPQLTEDQPAHRPLVAAHAAPWPGEMAVFRSPSMDGFELLTTFGSRARIGALVSDLYPGPTSRFDLGNALVVDLLTGTLESVTDLTLFGGANALAIESAPGVWEIVQAGAAELLAPGRYSLTRLLRGQRGTEGAMGNPAPAGARVVVLDTALASLPIAEADLGIPWNWRIGPASRPVSDETYVAQAFTPAGIGLRPFSVAHVEQPWRKPRTPGDLAIRWTRRSRALAADSWGGLEVPLAEEIEAYEVEILDGATVKRVLSTATTSAVYTAAQQTADWGAPPLGMLKGQLGQDLQGVADVIPICVFERDISDELHPEFFRDIRLAATVGRPFLAGIGIAGLLHGEVVSVSGHLELLHELDPLEKRDAPGLCENDFPRFGRQVPQVDVLQERWAQLDPERGVVILGRGVRGRVPGRGLGRCRCPRHCGRIRGRGCGRVDRRLKRRGSLRCRLWRGSCRHGRHGDGGRGRCGCCRDGQSGGGRSGGSHGQGGSGGG